MNEIKEKGKKMEGILKALKVGFKGYIPYYLTGIACLSFIVGVKETISDPISLLSLTMASGSYISLGRYAQYLRGADILKQYEEIEK